MKISTITLYNNSIQGYVSNTWIYIRKDFADSPFTINHEKKMQIFEPRVNNGRYIAGRRQVIGTSSVQRWLQLWWLLVILRFVCEKVIQTHRKTQLWFLNECTKRSIENMIISAESLRLGSSRQNERADGRHELCIRDSDDCF